MFFLVLQGKPGWIGLEDELLDGFPWKGGPNTHTDGIVLWSEIFVVKTPNGKVQYLHAFMQ